MAFGKTPSNFVEMVGRVYGHLTVVKRDGANKLQQARWLCTCVCGKSVTVLGAKLRKGSTTSCGCMKGKANRTHGQKETPTYNTWCALKQRCNYPGSKSYPQYGGRGIKVCDRWLHSFENFLADMGERPEGMTIDRIDSNGDYEPSNCRWIKNSEQQRNRRSTILIERDGVTKCVKDWCDELGLSPDAVYGRIRRGATPCEALR